MKEEQDENKGFQLAKCRDEAGTRQWDGVVAAGWSVYRWVRRALVKQDRMEAAMP